MTESFEFTSIGGREENQDALATCELDGKGIYLVADGLGGHRNGALASQRIVTSLMRAWKNDPDWDIEKLKKHTEAANREIIDIQVQTQSRAKSTLALVVLSQAKVLWANSGDSRIYRIRAGEICQITEDHSVAYRKYKNGEITKAEIAGDEDQSSLLRTLGSERRWEPDFYEDELKSGDAFLLCSDGFWEYISDEEMLVDWLKASSAVNWTRLMLLRILPRIPPNNDNLSVITVMHH